MAEAPIRVAPGVYRLGDEVVNFYLVETDDGLLLIDAGLPTHSRRLLDAIAYVGGELRAVVLTHAHPDHTGLAERAREQAGARVWVHWADAPILREGPTSAVRHARPERRMLRYLVRDPSALGIVMHLGGGFTSPKVKEYRTFGDDEVLTEVPGCPRTLAVPGHTRGSSAVVFDDRSLAFTGDALVTCDRMTGHEGPCVICRAFTQDSEQALASLDQLAALPEETLLLPGHGDPFTGGPRIAVIRARATGVR